MNYSCFVLEVSRFLKNASPTPGQVQLNWGVGISEYVASPTPNFFMYKISKSIIRINQNKLIQEQNWESTQVPTNFIIIKLIWHEINSHQPFWLTKKGWFWCWSPQIQRNWLWEIGIGSGLACLKMAKGIGSGQVRVQELAHLYFVWL